MHHIGRLFGQVIIKPIVFKRRESHDGMAQNLVHHPLRGVDRFSHAPKHGMEQLPPVSYSMPTTTPLSGGNAVQTPTWATTTGPR